MLRLQSGKPLLRHITALVGCYSSSLFAVNLRLNTIVTVYNVLLIAFVASWATYR